MPRISAARANEQRGRILDAALTCFAREGFHAATVQDIVEESGLSPGAIYGYFKGKTEIAMAIASERHAMERRRMEFALAAPDIDTSLRRLVEGFVLELRNPKERRWRHLAVQLWAESLSNPRLKREALAGVSQAVDVLAPMIAQAQRQGRWPRHLDPASAARVMVAVLQGISLQLAWDERVDIERFAVALRIMLDPRSDGSDPRPAERELTFEFQIRETVSPRPGVREGSTSTISTGCTAANFSRLPKSRDRRSIGSRRPNHGPSSKQRRRQWDKTSEVPEVHGALHWWALSRAVKPHFWKPYWRERAPSKMPAASMPELRSAMPAPRRATTRWAWASPPPPPPSWATVTPLSIVPARSSSRMTCAPRCPRSMPRSWSARRTRRSCRNCRSSCASWRISAFPVFCF